MTLKGTFQITDWQEKTEKTFVGDAKLNAATVKQSYQGDINGESEVRYMMNYREDGNANFTGYEYLTVQIDGQNCHLVLQHDGKFEAGVASSQFTVVDCPQLPDLVGKLGQFKSSENGQADYSLTR